MGGGGGGGMGKLKRKERLAERLTLLYKGFAPRTDISLLFVKERQSYMEFTVFFKVSSMSFLRKPKK